MKSTGLLFKDGLVKAILSGAKTQTRRIVRPQPVESIRNPPSYEDGAVGDLYVCPDIFDPSTRVFVERIGRATYHNMGSQVFAEKHCPYGRPGDQIWVRETWKYDDWTAEGEPWIRYGADDTKNLVEFKDIPEEWGERLVSIWEELSKDENYSIDHRASDRRWRPSIHMPKWASRITLAITGVRVERLQDISEADAIAEGITEEYVVVGANCHGGYHQEECDYRYFHGGSNCPEEGYKSAAEAFAALWIGAYGQESWDSNPWVWSLSFNRIKP